MDLILCYEFNIVFLECLDIPILFLYIFLNYLHFCNFYLYDKFALSKVLTLSICYVLLEKRLNTKIVETKIDKFATICITTPFIYACLFVIFHFKVHLSFSREQSGRIEIKKVLISFFPKSFTMKI